VDSVLLSSEEENTAADGRAEGAKTMATTASSRNLTAISCSASQGRPVRASGRSRRMTPAAGRAIEMLGHATEYLADEFALECMSDKALATAGTHPQLEAIELLKARNREIYLSCPELPTLGEWVRSLLRVLRA
jgi:hypothetical protein